MRKYGLLVGALLLGSVAVKPAEAQVQFGANIAWGDDTDFGVGGRLNFGLGSSLKAKGITAMATFDYFFPDGFDFWEATANGIYHINTASSTRPYVGAGVSLARSSFDDQGVCQILDCDASNSEFGLNLLGGVKFAAMGNVVPFVEARFAVRDGSQFVIAGGVFFGKP